MKRTIIKAIGVLIVELPEGAIVKAFDDVDDKTNIIYKDDDTSVLSYIQIPKGKYKHIGKYSEMTEWQFQQFMPVIVSKKLIGYKNYKKLPDYVTSSTMDRAKDSFLSAVEAEGWYIGENPLKKSFFNPEDFIQEEYEEYMKVQSRTLNPNLIHLFKIEE